MEPHCSNHTTQWGEEDHSRLDQKAGLHGLLGAELHPGQRRASAVRVLASKGGFRRAIFLLEAFRRRGGGFAAALLTPTVFEPEQESVTQAADGSLWEFCPATCTGIEPCHEPGPDETHGAPQQALYSTSTTMQPQWQPAPEEAFRPPWLLFSSTSTGIHPEQKSRPEEDYCALRQVCSADPYGHPGALLHSAATWKRSTGRTTYFLRAAFCITRIRATSPLHRAASHVRSRRG